MPTLLKDPPAPVTPVDDKTPVVAVSATPPPVDEKKDVADAARESESIGRLLGIRKSPEEKKADEDAKKKKEQEDADKAAADKKAADEKAEADKAAAGGAAPAEGGKSKTKVKKSAPQKVEPTQPTAEQTAKIVTDAVKPIVDAINKKPESPAIELDDDIKQLDPVYKQLEAANPEKYKPGLAERIQKFRQQEITRATEWEKANEGKSYNADDPEHAEFYSKNEPVIDAKDFKKAEFEIEYQERLARDVNPKMEEMNSKLINMEAAPAAVAMKRAFSVGLFGEVSQVKEFTKESVEKWAEENPFMAETVTEIESQLLPVVQDASLLWDGAVNLDTKKESHVAASNMFKRLETELAENEEPVKDEHGNAWVPLSQYSSMTPAQRNGHFTTSKESLVRYITLVAANDALEHAKKKQEIFNNYAEKMGFGKKEVSKVTPTPAPEKRDEPAATINSPAIASGAPPPAKTGVVDSGGAGGKSTLDRLLGL